MYNRNILIVCKQTVRATSKIEQNPQKFEKCSTRLQCGLRLRAKSQFLRFARKTSSRHPFVILAYAKKPDDSQ